MKRRSKRGLRAIIATALLLGILLVINLISTLLFKRVDLSEGKVYSLSAASREAVRKLDDKMVAKAYFTRGLKPPYNESARYLRDLLEDYRAYSGGKFSFEFVDPGSDSLLERAAASYRVPRVPVQMYEKNKMEAQNIYMGLVLLYGDKHETIPFIQQTTGLEYYITSNIRSLTSAKIPTVGILAGQGAPDSYQEMRNLRSVLEKNYQMRSVEVNGGRQIPADIDALLIVGATESFDDWTKFAVDQYIMRGGSVGFLLNKVNADMQTAQASQAMLGIDDWTANYGFKINDDLLMDLHCGSIGVRTPIRLGQFTATTMVNYDFYFTPIIYNLSSKSNITKDLENLLLFYPSTIDTSLAASKGVTLTPLIYSSTQAKVQKGRFDVNPFQSRQMDTTTFNEGPFVLGASLEGKFKSYFAGKAVPAIDSTGAVPANVTILLESPPTRLVVIGDGNIAQDAYISDQNAGINLTFLMNMIDWLARNEELMQMRSREVTARPLTEIKSQGWETTVKYANWFAPPAIVILIGLVRWQIRRSRKSREN